MHINPGPDHDRWILIIVGSWDESMNWSQRCLMIQNLYLIKLNYQFLRGKYVRCSKHVQYESKPSSLSFNTTSNDIKIINIFKVIQINRTEYERTAITNNDWSNCYHLWFSWKRFHIQAVSPLPNSPIAHFFQISWLSLQWTLVIQNRSGQHDLSCRWRRNRSMARISGANSTIPRRYRVKRKDFPLLSSGIPCSPSSLAHFLKPLSPYLHTKSHDKIR